MTDQTRTLDVVRQANPVPDPEAAAQQREVYVSLLAEIDRRSEPMADLRTRDERPEVGPRRRRAAWAFSGAFVLALSVIGIAAFLTRGGDEGPPVVTQPPVTTTAAPTTTTMDAPTTTQATTTTAATTTTVAPAEPVTISWAQAPTQSAFGAIDHVNAIVRGGPGLVAAGTTSALPDSEEWLPAAAVWISADALTWDRVDLPDAHDDVMIDMVEGPNGFVAAAGGHAWFSDDGFEWSAVDLAKSRIGGILDIVADERGYVILGEVESQEPPFETGVWSSVNGQTWTRVDGASIPVTEERDWQPLTHLAKAGDRLIFFGNINKSEYADDNVVGGWPDMHDPVAWTSDDGGVSWVRHAITDDRGFVGNAGSAAGLPVAFGFDEHGSTFWVSTDGVTWVRTGPSVSLAKEVVFRSILVDANRMLVVGSGSPVLWRSFAYASVDGGASWSEVEPAVTDLGGTILQHVGGFYDLVEFQGQIVVVGGTGNGTAPVWIGTWDD